MKKFICALLAVVLLFMLASCSPYVSSYSALGLVRSSLGGECSASFLTLDGRLVFSLRAPEGGEGDIKYTASLEEGKMSVYYDIYGTLEPLFTLEKGESRDSRGGYIEGGKSVSIVIDAVGARGSFSASLNN